MQRIWAAFHDKVPIDYRSSLFDRGALYSLNFLFWVHFEKLTVLYCVQSLTLSFHLSPVY